MVVVYVLSTIMFVLGFVLGRQTRRFHPGIPTTIPVAAYRDNRIVIIRPPSTID